MIGGRFAVAAVAAWAITVAPEASRAQSCSLTSALDSSWAINASSRSLAYARTTTVQLTRAGRYLAGGVSGGQTSVQEFDEVILEVEGFAGLTIPIRDGLQLCGRAGRFGWHGPSALLLTQRYYRSYGSYWSVGVLGTVRANPGVELVPSLGYSERNVRTSIRFLPPLAGQPPNVAEGFTMTTVDVSLALVLDDIAFAWISIEREHGMPTGTRFGPLGRKNGDNVFTFGFGFTRRDRGTYAQKP